MNIDIIKRKLLIKYPLFGDIMASANMQVNNNISTLATDGKDIYYNEKYLNNYSEDEQIFLFAHEICHIAFNHAKRVGKRNKKVWNIATDAVINAFLKHDGLKLVEGGIDIDEAINYDAEEMYEKLLNEFKDDEDKYGEVINHEMWEESLDNDKEENINEKEIFKENLKLKKLLLEDLKETLNNDTKKHGNVSSNQRRYISDIKQDKSLIDWRVLLREAINYDVDWSYENAEVEEGIVTSHLEDQLVPETEIVLDTSGSVDEDLLKSFLRECKNILKTSKVYIGCFDTEFYGFKEIKDEKDIDNYILKGNGGTNFDVAINAFSKRCENKIIFTDGRSDMPNRECDAIWIVYSNNKINPKGGKVIYVNKQKLKRLQNNK